jgi:hypothetical protein
MSNTYFKAMSVMGCEIGGITRRSLCRHNCCDGENCVTWLEKQFAKLNEYEEAKADGRLVVLPCKTGEKVYRYCNDAINEGTIINILLNVKTGEIGLEYEMPTCYTCSRSGTLGKNLFLTREAAEEALKDSVYQNTL